MKVLHVSSEMFPLLKTGGLADVVGALPLAQRSLGQDVRVLLPMYPALKERFPNAELVGEFDSFAGRVAVRYATYQGIGIYLLESSHLFARAGNPYHDDNYQDYTDNYLRFALLGFVGAGLASGWDTLWQPHVLHAHDWHSGLCCAYLQYWNNPIKTIFTIHNIAYQGIFSAHHLSEIDLPEHFLSIDGLEFHGQISYLKAGIFYADEVTTVSPTFAQEITHHDNGFGLHGLLHYINNNGHLHGILNGLDENIWNPALDTHLPAHYHSGAMQGKKKNKANIQQHFKLPTRQEAPLFVMLTRLVEQKGVDLFIDAIPMLMQEKAQVIVLGSGSPEYEQQLRALAEQYPENMGIMIGYDEDLAHRIIAGADVIVIPSRFEPCGLTQIYGLKYGTLPLVRKTGGLADTVTNITTETFKARTATGFVFTEISTSALVDSLKQAIELWSTPRKWNSVRANAMREENGWHIAAQKYQELYR